MHIKNHILLLLSCLLMSCSSSIPPEEDVITNSPTHPNVRQHLINSNKGAQQGDATFRPIRASVISNVQPHSGSLFNPQKAIGLFKPTINYQIGDMILVMLEEKTVSKKSLSYKLDKKDEFTLEPVSLNAGPIHVNDDDLNADYEQKKKFRSSTQTTQKNSLLGDITVYIREILPNGNFVVSGEKWFTLNKGEEYIRLSGDIRKTDIAFNNTISSVKIGNRRIEFSGKGEQQENQNKSLLSQFFSILD